jgi:hypothetical protein
MGRSFFNQSAFQEKWMSIETRSRGFEKRSQYGSLGIQDLLGSAAMKNQIRAIAPYWQDSVQTWVFDDPAAGLEQELFVGGVPEMIDDLVAEIPDARQGFRLLFSADPLPSFQRRLEWAREEMGGNWYNVDQSEREGRLCPALFRYFDETPAELYVKAESLKR